MPTGVYGSQGVVEGEVERVQEVGGKGRGRGSLLVNLAAKRAKVEEEDVEEGGVEEEYVA